MKKLVVAASLGIVLLAGCVSAGVQVKSDQLSEFKAGLSTEADVIAKLGRPTSTMLTHDGAKILSYSYVHAQARPSSFIPIVGAFVGGADSQTNITMFRFDNAGKLLSYSTSESQIGSGTGLAAGRPMEQLDQPKQAKE